MKIRMMIKLSIPKKLVYCRNCQNSVMTYFYKITHKFFYNCSCGYYQTMKNEEYVNMRNDYIERTKTTLDEYFNIFGEVNEYEKNLK